MIQISSMIVIFMTYSNTFKDELYIFKINTGAIKYIVYPFITSLTSFETFERPVTRLIKCFKSYFEDQRLLVHLHFPQIKHKKDVIKHFMYLITF